MVAFLTEHYPLKGKAWCMKEMGLKEHQIRTKASSLKLRQNRSSEFFKDWQDRAARSKVGKRRPEQAEVMKRAIHDRGLHIPDEAARKAIGNRVKRWISESGHPRGALGMRHTDEMRAKAREVSLNAWAEKSEEEKDEWSRRASGRQPPAGNRAKASWKAAWREIGGINKYFRSRWEANYARYLEWLKEKGEIRGWLHEPKTFWFEGIKRGCMSYLPDFEVTGIDGALTYHEVKGWMDDRSVTKIKRMAKYHPEIKLLIIDSKAYRVLERTMSGVISGWEPK